MTETIHAVDEGYEPMTEVTVNCRHDRSYRFTPEKTALLLIDLQAEFFTDDVGECADEMNAILPRAAGVLELARRIGCKVVYTRESYHPDLSDVHAYRQSLDYVGKPGPLGRFCIKGQPGHDIVDEVKPLPEETVIDKASFGAFYQTSLDEQLRSSGIEHLLLCGVTTQCCVHSTLREAVDRGYWCLTVADCCAASDPGMHEAALKIITGEGHLFGWICDATDLESGVAGLDDASLNST